MTKAIIFDLDGTLLYTLDSIAFFANRALAEYGLDTIPTQRYRALTGRGARKLVENMLAEVNCKDEKLLEDILSYYNKIYDDNFQYLTRPYDGIPHMLAEVTKLGIKTAVLSNKPHSTTAQLINEIFGDAIDIVFGGREDVPLKPDPTAVLEIIRMLGVNKDDIIYVGDTGIDMLTGKRAGLYTVGCTWGYGERKDLIENDAGAIIDSPGELLKIIAERG